MFSKRRIVVAAAVFFAICGVSYAGPPQTWQWKPSQAAAAVKQLGRFQPREQGGMIGNVTCQGRGKPNQGRWAAFKCSAQVKATLRAEYQTVPVWAKVRRATPPTVCVSTVSLAAVPADCLNPKGKRVSGDPYEPLRWTLTKRFMEDTSIPYQGPTDCWAHGSGFYSCSFGVGTATVLLRPTGAVVKITSLSCPDPAARGCQL